jgi:hypothetical protein
VEAQGVLMTIEFNDKEGLGPIEGNPNGWHIRLTRRIGTTETWALWNSKWGRQSSNMPKDVVLGWMRDEQKKVQSIARRRDG